MLLHHVKCDQGMKPLDSQVIDLVVDPHQTADEGKISSSLAREQLLGTLLRPSLKVSHATTFLLLS